MDERCDSILGRTVQMDGSWYRLCVKRKVNPSKTRGKVSTSAMALVYEHISVDVLARVRRFIYIT